MDNWRKNPLVFYVLSLPPGVWLLAFFFLPLTMVWFFSFGEKAGLVDINITWTWANYARALQPLYLQIFVKSLWFAGLTTLVCLALAFPIAISITFAAPKWRPLLLLLVILPFWTNLLIRTYALIAVLRSKGYVNFVLEFFWDAAHGFFNLLGVDASALIGTSFTPLPFLYNNFAVVFGLVYVHLPFMVLPLYAALERIDRSCIEASLDLGASQWRTFISVIAPMTMAGIVSGVIITFIPALGSFLTPDLLGGTDSQMIANVIERQFKSANDWPFGSALSFILMYVTFFALALRALIAGKQNRNEALH